MKNDPARQEHEITQLLAEWREGNQEALDELYPLVYDELHRLARRYMSRERKGHTLQTTALINEAYVRLVDQRSVQWEIGRASCRERVEISVGGGWLNEKGIRDARRSAACTG